ncbi:hypothetical protein TNCV_159681 [Trichonephila clavipes]|uniref:Uncharacterized protein n=1 Tax=Trichonephila clavipes TaxID=2585209 RepID=A0A8X6UUH2_TRICX|nr:hypothetical protein TNCV_159681 [Trichonephila clavipes]
MRIVSNIHLDDSLRWRAVGRLEAAQSQAEEVRRQTMVSQLAPDLAVVPGRRIFRQTVHSGVAQTGIYTRRSVWCVSLTASSRKNWISWS